MIEKLISDNSYTELFVTMTAVNMKFNITRLHWVLMVTCLVVRMFDECIDKRDVYKVATIGDAYFVASGLPHTTTDHSRQVCLLALDIQRAVKKFRVAHLPSHRLRQRIGVHCGITHTSVRCYMVLRWSRFQQRKVVTVRVQIFTPRLVIDKVKRTAINSMYILQDDISQCRSTENSVCESFRRYTIQQDLKY